MQVSIEPKARRSMQPRRVIEPQYGCLMLDSGIPRSGSTTKPGVAQRTPGQKCEILGHPEGGATKRTSVPSKSLIKIQAVNLAQSPKLILKRFAAMVFFLIRDVHLELFNMAGTNRKCPIATKHRKPFWKDSAVRDQTR
jgi:hypothetical protein